MSDNLIIKKGSAIYTLPKMWGISGNGDYTFNAKFADNAYSHGSSVTGDKMSKGRTIEITFDALAETQEEHDAVVNEAYFYFNQTDYTLIAGREDRYYNVNCLQKIKHKWVKGFKQRYSEVTITLMLADPFRYSNTPIIYSKVMKDEMQVIINNIGNVLSPLLINVSPVLTADDVKIIHNHDKEMTLKDSTLTVPANCNINSQDGTVYRGSINNINTFDGSFLQINPGINSYQYFGNEALVTFTFTPRWFI